MKAESIHSGKEFHANGVHLLVQFRYFVFSIVYFLAEIPALVVLWKQKLRASLMDQEI